MSHLKFCLCREVFRPNTKKLLTLSLCYPITSFLFSLSHISVIPMMATICQPLHQHPFAMWLKNTFHWEGNLFLHSSNLGWLMTCFGWQTVLEVKVYRWAMWSVLILDSATALWRILSLFGGGQENTWRKLRHLTNSQSFLGKQSCQADLEPPADTRRTQTRPRLLSWTTCTLMSKNKWSLKKKS